MNIAMQLAQKAYKNGDIPVGAIIVKDNKIISKTYNKKEKNNIATHHAEMLAIEKACKKLKTWHLDDCILYTTLEPCIMCVGAIAQARIKKIVYAAENEKFGFTNYFKNGKISNHNLIIEKLEDSSLSKKLLVDFFKDKR